MTLRGIKGCTDSYIWYNRIRVKSIGGEYDKNQFSDCQKTCEEIIKTNPENAVALRGLGCIAQIKGEFSKAVKFYEKALQTSKNKEIEYTLIGTVYYLQNDLEKAIENYNLAIQINENYEQAYEGRNQSMLENHLKILDLQDSLIEQELRSYWLQKNI